MKKQMDELLYHALTPTDEPDIRLNRHIFNQIKAGEEMTTGKRWGEALNSAITVVGALLCLLVLTAFAYSSFSGIAGDAGDEVGFAAVYQREGVLEMTVIDYSSVLAFETWAWPTVSEKICAPYGAQRNGTISDHINIAGNTGDSVYSVADGTVKQTGFDVICGNYILLDLGDGVTVKYGHLKEILTEEGETVNRGQEIGTLGATGMATGSNLSFAVYLDGVAVNPLEFRAK